MAFKDQFDRQVVMDQEVFNPLLQNVAKLISNVTNLRINVQVWEDLVDRMLDVFNTRVRDFWQCHCQDVVADLTAATSVCSACQRFNLTRLNDS